jgi:hypothetical protein
MSKFEKIENDCLKAMQEYNLKDNLAFQSGYYKAISKMFCHEIEQLEQEISSLRAELLDLQKELA